MTLLRAHLIKQRRRILALSGFRLLLQLSSVAALIWLMCIVAIVFGPGFAPIWVKTCLLLSAGLIIFGCYQMIIIMLKARSPEKIARIVEHRNPGLGFKLRTSLDFQKDLAQDKPFQQAFLSSVEKNLGNIPLFDLSLKKWIRLFVLGVFVLLSTFFLSHTKIKRAFRTPEVFSSDRALLLEGTVTLFEPDYTRIPGRTLPLEKRHFEAFPGSRIRLNLSGLDPDGTYKIHTTSDEKEKTFPLKKGMATQYEFLLEQDTRLAVIFGERGVESKELTFKTLPDLIPVLEIKSHTEEGEINPRNPLFIEADIQDDFGVKELALVIQWDEPESDSEKRISLQVPPSQSSHFRTRNQWNVSDLVPDDVESFSIFLEAQDNNPFNGPGVGQSKTLHFGITTPEKLRREFMNQVQELLNSLVLGLADNLTTAWTNGEDRTSLMKARDKGNAIQSAVFRARDISSQIEISLRNQTSVNGLDRKFFRTMYNALRRALDDRLKMSQLFAELHYTNRLRPATFKALKRLHGNEETSLENLVYDLILQMKLWALMEMEQSQADVEATLSEMENLLENSENMELDQLKKEIDKLMDELMKEMSEMFQKAAEEMDLTMQEFMNQEAMQENQQELNDLKKQLQEALEAGDMEKAKEILAAMKQSLEAMMNSMKESVGEMSPEMKEMMKALQELLGLLGALKEGEETLESDTQDLKREIDERIAELMPSMSEEMKAEFKEIIEKILEILNQTDTRLTRKDFNDWADPVFKRMGELNVELRNHDPGKSASSLQKELRKLDRALGFLSTNGLDRFQTIILKAIGDTKRLGELLDQFEFFEALEAAHRLQSSFFGAKLVAQGDLPSSIEKEIQAKQSFNEASVELQKIIDFLEKLRQMRDNLRSQHLQQSNQGDSQKLAKRQQNIEEMIPDFLSKYEEALKRFPMINQLKSIQNDMGKAGKRLGQNRLGKGLKHEQDALRKLGELQEQMMQMQQGQGKGPPLMLMPNQPQPGQISQMGDPTGPLFIPDAERKARQSALKDQILKKLQKNLPQSHSKEIKAYYERLMDQ